MNIETVIRALKLLKILAYRSLSVQEAADELEVHKSTASRLLATMQKEGFVRLNSNRKYELGSAVFELSNIWSANLDIRSLIRPYLELLNNETDETVHLSILNASEITYIDKIDSSKSVRMHSTIGHTAPAYCTGVGKVLLAYQDFEEIKRILSKKTLQRYTDTTITDLEELIEELRKIRAVGLAWDNGEHEEEIHCIAAPIFGNNNKVIASVSISAPKTYTPMERLSSYKGLLSKTAEEVSNKLGYIGKWPPILR